jgi:hypothetical protein
VSRRGHFHDDSIGTATGAYDLNYIEAVLNNDPEEVQQIEQAAFDLGYGPTVECSTVSNTSSQRAICRQSGFFLLHVLGLIIFI